MATCTLQDVTTAAQNLLGDPSGLWATSAILIPYAGIAYRKMFDALAAFDNNRVEHTIYFELPAYTSIWQPVANGVTDMAEPIKLEERGAITTGAIASTDTSTPIQVTTSSAHNLGSNTDLIITGVANTKAPWGRWFNTVTGSTTFTLKGSVSDAVAGTGGKWSTSPEKFIEVDWLDSIPDFDPGSALRVAVWQNNAIYFRGATQDRELELEYVASGTAPTQLGTTINIDNCLNYLAAGTAYYAAQARNWEIANAFRGMAFGPKGEGDASGGFLRDLIASSVLNMQRKTRSARMFRPVRQHQSNWWLW